VPATYRVSGAELNCSFLISKAEADNLRGVDRPPQPAWVCLINFISADRNLAEHDYICAANDTRSPRQPRHRSQHQTKRQSVGADVAFGDTDPAEYAAPRKINRTKRQRCRLVGRPVCTVRS
jgi:hypothetical protein